jgi:hypothetical protein
MIANAFCSWAAARKRAADAKRDAKRDLTAAKRTHDADHHDLSRWDDDGGCCHA